jgi:hypothetical protein
MKALVFHDVGGIRLEGAERRPGWMKVELVDSRHGHAAP